MDHFSRLAFEIAELKRQMANMVTPGAIKEVKGDKVRMTLGKGSDGQDVLGPWVPTNDRRGGARTRNNHKEGQNGWLFSPTGDPSQSLWIPGGPNEKYDAPDHADDSDQQEQGGGGGGGGGSGQSQQGQQSQKKEEETYQQDHFRKKFTTDGGVWFRQEPNQKQQQQQQDQGGQGGQGGGDQNEDGDNSEMPKRSKQKPEGDQIMRLHKEDGVEGRDGKGQDAAKFTAHKKGARIRKGKVYVVTEPGRILLQGAIAYFEKPPRIKKIPDPIPNDDKTDV